MNLPLKILDLETDLFIIDKNGKLLANLAIRDYAQFIVRACNCHYELLEKCKQALTIIRHLDRFGAYVSIRIEIEQAIAKAEGKREGE